MPYNVICLACTVAALAFGPLYNITTKQLVLVPPEQEEKSLLGNVVSIILSLTLFCFYLSFCMIVQYVVLVFFSVSPVLKYRNDSLL